MILVDTSAWIEFLRDTGSPSCERVTELLGLEIATCDPVRMEVFAGARDEAHLRSLRGLLARATTLETSPTDYEDAAALYRGCRRGGETERDPAAAAGRQQRHSCAQKRILALRPPGGLAHAFGPARIAAPQHSPRS